MLAAGEVVRLLGGQGRQGPSPCFALKLPGGQAVGEKRKGVLSSLPCRHQSSTSP